MDLNDYCKKCYATAKEKKFWDDIPPWHKDRGCLHYYNSKLMLIVSELAEACDALREERFGIEEKDTFEDELADVLIRTFDLCGALGVDIQRQVDWKMKYNKTREPKHGVKF